MGPAAGGKGSGEQALARRLYPGLEEDWLLLADRNFYSFKDWCAAAGTGAALLWRVWVQRARCRCWRCCRTGPSSRCWSARGSIRGRSAPAGCLLAAAAGGQDLPGDWLATSGLLEYPGELVKFSV